jgi:hypothetical protein
VGSHERLRLFHQWLSVLRIIDRSSQKMNQRRKNVSMLGGRSGPVEGEREEMTTVEDFKIKSHELLVELDTATSEMMALICVHQMSGTAWDEAVRRQHEAYEQWVAYLNERS